MKQGKGKWIETNGKVLGIEMDGTFTAEHECGIRNLANIFQLNGNGLGFKKFLAGTLPQLYIRKGTIQKKPSMLVACNERRFYHMEQSRTIVDAANWCNLMGWGFNAAEESLNVAWDSDSFAILAIGKEQVRKLDELLEGMRTKKFYLFADRSRMVFDTNSLNIVLDGYFTPQQLEEARQADLDQIALMKMANKTRIAKKIKKAGLGYCALMPRWEHDCEKGQSKWPIRFFLNPEEQNKYNFGWFTVEELVAWTKGKGPVIKEKA